MTRCQWAALALLVLAGCHHPRTHAPFCPVGAVRIDPPTYSGGTELGEGFRTVPVADGIAAYRDDEQNGETVQCAFVCPTGSRPQFKRDKLVCQLVPKGE
jgi:hypothetical protein